MLSLIQYIKDNLKQQGDIIDNKGYNNLSKGARIARKELSDHTEIIITKADKGGSTVITDVKDYINEAHRQLNNKSHYKILNKDSTTTNAKLVNDTIRRFKTEKLLKERLQIARKFQTQKLQNYIYS